METTSENTKIFGVGFGKTGTTSLEKACQIIGYNVCQGNWRNNFSNYLIGLYVNNDIPRIMRFVKDFDAFFDAPWGGTDLYESLITYYPKSKYILTWREPEKWYESFERELAKPFGSWEEFGKNRRYLFDRLHTLGRYGDAILWPHVFGVQGLLETRSQVIEKYMERHKKIKTLFCNNDIDFIEMNVTSGDGWEKLCTFLNVEYPLEKFPHMNRGTQREQKRKASGIRKHKFFGANVRRSIKGFKRIWLQKS